MAKISPVSIKYMIHANFVVEGALEKPDVIGALFGQTEGLLGADLEMRELQKEGKIGRIEVDLEKDGKRTMGKVQIPTALDQSETTLIAAAIETIDRIGPCDANIEVDKIEDVRGSKRDYILERAKKLMQGLQEGNSSREFSNEIKDSTRTSAIQEYGDEKVPAGDLSGKEIIVVEGRADVVNLLKNNVKNVVGMNGTKLPETIKELGKTKELTLFRDGDRGGILIAQNVIENANVAYVASAPDGKEVEELTGKEILLSLRKKVSVSDFLKSLEDKPQSRFKKFDSEPSETSKAKSVELTEDVKKELKEVSKDNSGSGKAVMLDADLNEMKKVSSKTVSGSLGRMNEKPSVLVIDDTVNSRMISAAEEAGVSIIVAKNFGATSESIKLLSF